MTNHSEQITDLRNTAMSLERGDHKDSPDIKKRIIMFNAAAALLEVHDDTGISLDNWKGPREFVEMMLGEPIQENHV